MLLDCLEDGVDAFDVHVGGVDQLLQLHKLVPDLLLEDGLGGYREALRCDEVGLLLVAEVGVGLEELLKPVLLGLEFAVLILEHADGASRVDDEDLPPYDERVPCGCLAPRRRGSRCWWPPGSARGTRICRGCHCSPSVNIFCPGTSPIFNYQQKRDNQSRCEQITMPYMKEDIINALPPTAFAPIRKGKLRSLGR